MNQSHRPWRYSEHGSQRWGRRGGHGSLIGGIFAVVAAGACPGGAATQAGAPVAARPHVVFVMADDMGWGQTGYRGHAVLQTPHLDAMAAGGLRFERFYAGGPVCSPTRAAMLTGRTPDRGGVFSHGHALRLQERTLPTALAAAGYVTGHFGKWHLDGLRGPGVPILASDPRGPGKFGFEEWVSVTNFFDRDPLLSRGGEFVAREGDSSEVIVAEAIEFLRRHRDGDRPMFAVIWFGSPHSPFQAAAADTAGFATLDDASAHHHGELVAMDRSLGTLRAELRALGIADDTLLVFCSDNGGLPKIEPDTVGGLRGRKGSLYEGGIRVPGIIEWPAVIRPRVTGYPACVMDLVPTIGEIVGLPADDFLEPLDGVSLVPLFAADIPRRGRPIGFRSGRARALVDDRFKLVTPDIRSARFELYDLLEDPAETRDVAAVHPEEAARLEAILSPWNDGVNASVAGADYPGGRVSPADPEPAFWPDTDPYRPFLETLATRPEYADFIRRPRRPVRRPALETDR
jgi:arylsulfatase A-like enzyme